MIQNTGFFGATPVITRTAKKKVRIPKQLSTPLELRLPLPRFLRDHGFSQKCIELALVQNSSEAQDYIMAILSEIEEKIALSALKHNRLKQWRHVKNLNPIFSEGQRPALDLDMITDSKNQLAISYLKHFRSCHTVTRSNPLPMCIVAMQEGILAVIEDFLHEVDTCLGCTSNPCARLSNSPNNAPAEIKAHIDNHHLTNTSVPYSTPVVTCSGAEVIDSSSDSPDSGRTPFDTIRARRVARVAMETLFRHLAEEPLSTEVKMRVQRNLEKYPIGSCVPFFSKTLPEDRSEGGHFHLTCTSGEEGPVCTQKSRQLEMTSVAPSIGLVDKASKMQTITPNACEEQTRVIAGTHSAVVSVGNTKRSSRIADKYKSRDDFMWNRGEITRSELPASTRTTSHRAVATKRRQVGGSKANMSRSDVGRNQTDNVGSTDGTRASEEPGRIRSRSPKSVKRTKMGSQIPAMTLMGCKNPSARPGKYTSRRSITQKQNVARERNNVRKARRKLDENASAVPLQENQEHKNVIQKAESDISSNNNTEAEALAFCPAPAEVKNLTRRQKYDILTDRKQAKNLGMFDLQTGLGATADFVTRAQKGEFNSTSIRVAPCPVSEELGSCDVEVALLTGFGFQKFLPSQKQALEKIDIRMNDPDDRSAIMLLLPTGGGKSLVYQFTAMRISAKFKYLTVVVVPTLALISDQLRSISPLLSSARFDSTLSLAESAAVIQCLNYGLLDVLLVTPEQFVHPNFRQAVLANPCRPIGMICIDEAHCISEWGHSFRPAYLRVLDFCQRVYSTKLVLALTATASVATAVSIEDQIGTRFLGVGAPQSGCGGFSVIRGSKSVLRDNLHMKSTLCESYSLRSSSKLDFSMYKKVEELVKNHQKHFTGMSLVYVWQKHVTEKLALSLRSSGMSSTVYYHSSMLQEERTKIEESMLTGKCKVVVATMALGIGVDSRQVSQVVHLNMPATLEQYVQETGRCNRDGSFQTGQCHLILNPIDFREHDHQIRGSKVDEAAIKRSFKKFSNLWINDNSNRASAGNVFVEKSNSFNASVKGIQRSFKIPWQSNNGSEQRRGDSITLLTCVIPQETALEMTNFRTLDDLAVFSTLVTDFLSGNCSQRNECFFLENLKSISDSCPVSQARFDTIQWQEINSSFSVKCFDEDLEALSAKHVDIKKCLPFMKRNGMNGAYEFDHMAYLCREDEGFFSSHFVDTVEKVESYFKNLSLEARISVTRSKCNKAYYTLSFCRLFERHEVIGSTVLMESIHSAVSLMSTNNRATSTRLDAAFVAFHIGARQRVSGCGENLQKQFIEDYFCWDAPTLQLPRAELWTRVVSKCEWLPFSVVEIESLFSKPFACYSPSVVDIKRLELNIERLIVELCSSSSAEIVSEFRDKDTGQNLRSITPLLLARILVGINSDVYNYKTACHLTGWNEYREWPFERVLRHASFVCDSYTTSSIYF